MQANGFRGKEKKGSCKYLFDIALCSALDGQKEKHRVRVGEGKEAGPRWERARLELQVTGRGGEEARQ